MTHDQHGLAYIIMTHDQVMTLTVSDKDDRMGRPCAFVTDPKEPLRFYSRRDAEAFAQAYLPQTVFIKGV